MRRGNGGKKDEDERQKYRNMRKEGKRKEETNQVLSKEGEMMKRREEKGKETMK